jgi:pyruvate/2-oxoglutarate dehydrogenase complex dihydrolipoamide acyltransferase (E2) component
MRVAAVLVMVHLLGQGPEEAGSDAMSLGDLIVGLMGGGNPLQQVAAIGQPGPQGSPPAAGGPGAGVGGPAAAGGAPGAPQGQPLPQAYQSPPDMAAANAKLAQGPSQALPSPTDYPLLYLQMVQRQQASDNFNRHLAGMLGGFKGPPGGAQDIMNSVGAPSRQDPGALMQNILMLRQGAYQDQQRQALAAAAPQLAQQMGVPLATAQAIIASGKYGDVETALTGAAGDPNFRQYMLERARAGQAAASPPAAAAPVQGAPISPSPAGGAGQGLRAPAPGGAALSPPTSGLGNPATAAGAPPDAAVDDYPTWLAKKQAATAAIGEISKERTAAKLALPGNDEQLNNIDTAIESIKTDPNLANVLGQALPTTGLASTLVGRSSEDQQLAQRIDTLNKQVFSEGFKTGGGSRKTQQELNTLQGALGQGVQATYLPPAQYIQNLTRLQDQIRTTRANGYGEAGNFSTLPATLNGYVDPAYRSGGMLEAPNAPQFKPMSDAQRAKISAAIAAAPHDREQILSTLKANNFDPRGF